MRRKSHRFSICSIYFCPSQFYHKPYASCHQGHNTLIFEFSAHLNKIRGNIKGTLKHITKILLWLPKWWHIKTELLTLNLAIIQKRKKAPLSPDQTWSEENGAAEETRKRWPERSAESLKNTGLQKEVFQGHEGDTHRVGCCQGNKSEEGWNRCVSIYR